MQKTSAVKASKSEWEDFSLSDEVLKFEAQFIKKALKETNGAVTKAAELLGLSHQHLSLLLKTRHKDLAAVKKPRKKRSDRKKKITVALKFSFDNKKERL